MKFKAFLVIAAAAAMLFPSCGEKEPETGAAELTIKSEATVNFESAESSQTVKFVATREWTAKVSETATSWLSVTPTSGKASSKEQTLTIEVLGNPEKDRFGTVTVSILSGTLVLGSKTITVNQKGEKGSSFVTIASVRAQAPTGENAVTIADGTMIKGTLLSNTDLNNLSSKKILYVQDETGGVQLFLDSNSTFKRGDVVTVDLSGASMKLYNGMIEIDDVKLANVAKDPSTATLEAKAISMEDFLANKYESQYVALENVQVTNADLNKKWVVDGKATSINFENVNGGTFVVRSSQYSSYKDQTVPSGNGTIKGIATIYNGTLQLLFTAEADYAGLTGERQKPAETETNITAVLAGQVSGIAIVEGVVIGAGKTSFVLNDGGEKNLYVYKQDATDVPAVGSTVKVKGTVAKYGASELIQLADFEVSQASGTYTPVVAESVALDAAAVDAYNKNWAENVTVTGKLKKSGNYFNIEISGAKRVGSIVASALTDKLEDGAMYDFTGFFGGISGTTTQYFNILPSTITESDKPYLEVANTEIPVGSDKTSATIDVVTNCDWTAVSDNEGFTVSPASGSGSAKITVTFAANTDVENARVAHIKVSTEAEVANKEITVTITQSRASAANEKSWTLDSDAIKNAHSAAWQYTSGDKKVTAADGSVWTLFNTYANKNQVTVQMNKGKGSYVLTPDIPEGNEVKRITVDVNAKADGSGDVSERPIDILSEDGKTTLLNDVNGKTLKAGLDVPAGNGKVRITCDETNGAAIYIVSITITYAPK